jgi:hypothetical protein
MKGTLFQNLLKDTVGGMIGNEIKSTEEEFPQVLEREETFFAISLDVKNKKTLEEALDLYIKPDFLEGDNKYMSEKYNRKIDAQKRSYFKSLQDTVIIHLKRFEFDYNSMQRLKVNDYCEFPDKLNLKPWTKEGIRERERHGKQKNEEGEGNSLDEDVTEQIKRGEAAPIDEDLESGGSNGEEGAIDALMEDEEVIEDDECENMNSMMDTGKYFDEGVMEDFIDIAADDDEIEGKEGMRRHAKSGQAKPRSGHPLREKPRSDSHQLQNEDKLMVKKELKVTRKKRSAAKSKEMDDSYYEYELVGVLVHSGSADSGHYYSFIKERQGGNSNKPRWLEFNDAYVREFDSKNLGIECFGGN